MMEFEDFEKLVEHIRSQGFDEATAAAYATHIGDTPELSEDGLWIVREGTVEVARIQPLW